jgi:hypothetical protein
VAIKRANYSLEALLERYPKGVPPEVIAAALCLTEEEVEEIYQDIVARFREIMDPDHPL